MHRPKKSLGQHFLRSTSALHAIVTAGKLQSSDTVLEIGPGEGVLTEKLLETGVHVIAIEKDDSLIPVLTERLKTYKNFTLIHGDVLSFNPKEHGLIPGGYKIIANIPYYITGAIFEKFLEEETYPNTMVLLIQKEVATRILARDGKESILSVSIKAFGKPSLVAKVPKGAFTPPPTVDSAIVSIEDISHKKLSGLDIRFFFSVVRTGFSHKRKFVLSNLSILFEKEKLLQIFEDIALDQKVRAEDIALDTWIVLSKKLAP